jgi:predicted nucleic acid-binding protein
LARRKFGFALDEINALIALLRSQGKEIEKPEPLLSSLPDPGDDKFLACAKAASVDFIVTGNKRHFPPRACGAIRVVNAAQLLDRITLELRLSSTYPLPHFAPRSSSLSPARNC